MKTIVKVTFLDYPTYGEGKIVGTAEFVFPGEMVKAPEAIKKTKKLIRELKDFVEQYNIEYINE